jgi:hypothetical protein
MQYLAHSADHSGLSLAQQILHSIVGWHGILLLSIVIVTALLLITLKTVTSQKQQAIKIKSKAE